MHEKIIFRIKNVGKVDILTLLTAIRQIQIALLVNFHRQFIFAGFQVCGCLLFHQFGLDKTLFLVQFPRFWLLFEVVKCHGIFDGGICWDFEAIVAIRAESEFWPNA